jgi:hypothetical protein
VFAAASASGRINIHMDEHRTECRPDSVLWLPWLLLKSLSRFRVIATLSLALLNLSSRMCARATLCHE